MKYESALQPELCGRIPGVLRCREGLAPRAQRFRPARGSWRAAALGRRSSGDAWSEVSEILYTHTLGRPLSNDVPRHAVRHVVCPTDGRTCTTTPLGPTKFRLIFLNFFSRDFLADCPTNKLPSPVPRISTHNLFKTNKNCICAC